MTCPLFTLGRVMATPAARDALLALRRTPRELLNRHATGDWGDLGDDDKRANAVALQTGSRILSAYDLPGDLRVWVLTEAVDDLGRRAATTILLPEEY